MNAVEIIFSPTGGTQKVSEIITEQWNLNTQKIDLTNHETDFSDCEIDKNNLVLVAMPVFGSRPPAIAIERLKQIKGNGARCAVACVYGNGAYDNTLDEMRDAAQECGFEVVAAVAAIAQHSIIPEYAPGRPDEHDIGILKEFAQKIKSKHDRIASDLKRQIQIEEDSDDSKPVPPSQPPFPKPTESCIKCGICADNCPLQAISGEDFNADIMKCIFCMRCVSQCPNESRRVDEDVISMAAVALKDTCSGRKENELFL